MSRCGRGSIPSGIDLKDLHLKRRIPHQIGILKRSRNHEYMPVASLEFFYREILLSAALIALATLLNPLSWFLVRSKTGRRAKYPGTFLVGSRISGKTRNRK